MLTSAALALLYVLGAGAWYRLYRQAQHDADEMPTVPRARAVLAGIAWPFLAVLVCLELEDDEEEEDA